MDPEQKQKITLQVATRMTISDGLSELKRIDKVLSLRYNNISRYASKRRNTKDEISEQRDFVKRQVQSAEDLVKRYAKIKTEIQRANLNTKIVYKEWEFTIAEALLYKHYLFEKKMQIHRALNANNASRQINEYRSMLGARSTSDEIADKLDLVPELLFDEKKNLKDAESIVECLAYIDRLIDKANHETTIDIALSYADPTQ